MAKFQTPIMAKFHRILNAADWHGTPHQPGQPQTGTPPSAFDSLHLEVFLFYVLACGISTLVHGPQILGLICRIQYLALRLLPFVAHYIVFAVVPLTRKTPPEFEDHAAIAVLTAVCLFSIQGPAQELFHWLIFACIWFWVPVYESGIVPTLMEPMSLLPFQAMAVGAGWLFGTATDLSAIVGVVMGTLRLWITFRVWLRW